MYALLRPFLFRLSPERAHALSLQLVNLAGRFAPVRAALRAVFETPAQPVELFGLRFANRVGLAAGYDKDGLGWRGLACLGFGHLELGTVTPRPQPGHPKPRLFRLPEDGAIINRMGFPGRGAEFMMQRLQGPRPPNLILGVNMGKNKDTPLDVAAEDYLSLLRSFAPLADYLTINVSSPNTVGLRRLQARRALGNLLSMIASQRHELQLQLQRKIPLLVKLAPDLGDDELDDALQAICDTGMDGVIATNTTLSREGVHSTLAGESGGLSGSPLGARSTAMVAKIHQRTRERIPIIGVGGIMDAKGAQEKLDAGASLVQIYSGLVYAGPGLVKSILKGLES